MTPAKVPNVRWIARLMECGARGGGITATTLTTAQ